ncbi:hypothetical protein BDV97DRAFT_369811 [Delphinella strobiligena]|nr:hypothetical protein BDV97DRAFT_369811 [Delphinella strobiligena]
MRGATGKPEPAHQLRRAPRASTYPSDSMKIRRTSPRSTPPPQAPSLRRVRTASSPPAPSRLRRTLRASTSPAETDMLHFLKRTSRPPNMDCQCLKTPASRSITDDAITSMSLHQKILTVASRLFPSEHGPFEIVFELVEVKRERFQDFSFYNAGHLEYHTSEGPRYTIFRCQLVGHRSPRRPSKSTLSSSTSGASPDAMSIPGLKPGSGSGSTRHSRPSTSASTMMDCQADELTLFASEYLEAPSREDNGSPVSFISEPNVLLESETTNVRVLALRSLWSIIHAAQSRSTIVGSLPVIARASRDFDGICSACGLLRSALS